ncbi:hypothetical protein H9I45_03275 [Polaribacter haliotis]|uniref:Uncharacterized protein n=1 Tax=Polaribacter haliotis TaxID=1888915 RepID=A0A7L8AHL7_9FLAO|nr:hypothetical protein [Polaribacter haliotis]QOD61486.1 hypothetical protein H9I45_03275 [Polaribacter haliotis]
MKKSTIFLFLFGVTVILAIIIVINLKDTLDLKSAEFWVYRVVVSLGAAAISISIPGMLTINYTPKSNDYNTEVSKNSNRIFETLAEKESAIVASGGIAVFVLVYLFNPISIS